MPTVTCKKCTSSQIDVRECKEIGGQPVGPYTIYQCKVCSYEWYEEKQKA